jgi:hypothetical protein
MAGGQADLSAWSLVLSNMVRAIISSAKMAFRQDSEHTIENLSGLGNSRKSRETMGN